MLKQFFNAAITSAQLHDTSVEGEPVIDAMLGSEGVPPCRCAAVHALPATPFRTRIFARCASHHMGACMCSAQLACASPRALPERAGKFGFVEFRTIAEATSCMALNNIELGGKQLRVERPRDYAPMPEQMHEDLRKAG